MSTSTVLTGIDLPADGLGGSMVLLDDLYSLWENATVVTLEAGSSEWLPPFSAWRTLRVRRGDDRRRYNMDLRSALTEADLTPPTVLHCQHLAFSMSEALLDSYPAASSLALCHGTDVIEAEQWSERAVEMRNIIGRVSGVIFPTSGLRDRVKRLVPGGLDTVESHLIPWGVPVERLRQAVQGQTKSPLQETSVSIMYAGRLDAEKGFETFAEALDFLPREWQIKIASPAEAANAELTHLGIEHPVELLGWLPREELWREFAKATVLVVPSTTLEAFGLTAVEAMLCRVPVVYADVPGLRQIVGRYGRAFSPRNPRSLSVALLDVVCQQMELSFPLDAAAKQAEQYDVARTRSRLMQLTAGLASARKRLPKGRGAL